jgi:hypothetical protein
VGEHSVFLLSGADALGAGVHVDQCGVGDDLYSEAEDFAQVLILWLLFWCTYPLLR